MVNLESLLFFMGAALLLAITPGPDILYVLTRGIAQGTRAAVAATMGFSCCIMVHTSFAIVGLSALLKASAMAFMVVKILGAIYLIYLGVRMIRDKSHFEITGKNKHKKIKQIFWQSVFAGTLNPKLAIFFLAFLPQFIDAQNGAIWSQLLELGIVFMLIAMIVFLSAGLFAAQIGKLLKRNQKIAGGIRYGAGSVLCLLGITLAIHDG